MGLEEEASGLLCTPVSELVGVEVDSQLERGHENIRSIPDLFVSLPRI